MTKGNNGFNQGYHDERAERILGEVEGLGDLSTFTGEEQEENGAPDASTRGEIQFPVWEAVEFLLGNRKREDNFLQLTGGDFPGSPILKAAGPNNQWINLYKVPGTDKIGVRLGFVQNKNIKISTVRFEQAICEFHESEMIEVIFAIAILPNRVRVRYIEVVTEETSITIQEDGIINILE